MDLRLTSCCFRYRAKSRNPVKVADCSVTERRAPGIPGVYAWSVVGITPPTHASRGRYVTERLPVDVHDMARQRPPVNLLPPHRLKPKVTDLIQFIRQATGAVRLINKMLMN